MHEARALHMITGVQLITGLGGYFHDDQEAIRHGAVRDGELYVGQPVTAGYATVRVPARTVGIGLTLDDGQTVWGDALSVQYSGAGGREPAFDPATVIPEFRDSVVPRLRGLEVASFREADRRAQHLLEELSHGQVAVAYGLSQALLAAAAHVTRRTMAEVLCDEFDLPVVAEPVPIYAQSGDNRRDNADKMILKGVDVLPHGLINAPSKFGGDGVILLDYVRWLRERIITYGPPGYAPVLHFDLYGVAGQVFGMDIERVADYLRDLADAARPFSVRIESPMDFGSRAAQFEGFAALRGALAERQADVGVVADEWCNTLEDVREWVRRGAADMLQIKTPDLGSLANSVIALGACHAGGVGVFLGGSCTETDISARACVHVAVATQPAFQLAKPGMGVDEGLMVVYNEQARLLSTLHQA
jgi:methylaspartate ammonia-lyase